ncbi:MAG: hypothetical protein HN348_08660 [Proteobacteria bacterium]|jgi:hypothetical protein|nr:hypothetical protein [Pseudomonadota bacterium]
MLFLLFLFGCEDVELDQRLARLEAEHRALEAKHEHLVAEVERLDSRTEMLDVLTSLGDRGAHEPALLSPPEDKTVEFKPDEWAALFNENGALPMHIARELPHRGPDGEHDGVRMSGIRRNSPFDVMGIRNGDIVHSVNGEVFRGTIEDLQLQDKITSKTSKCELKLTRRSRAMTLTILGG